MDEVLTPDQRSKSPKYTAVIPVYNSAELVGKTIQRTADFFHDQGWEYEIILVNDGSTDGSWDVLQEWARSSRYITAIDLLHNYGQHTAIFCGFQRSSGDYVITLDDDLQNPPEEIVHLVNKAQEGHDLVFGRFHQKQHASYRRLGSKIIGLLNNWIFHKPKDLTITNFRLIRQDVIKRICAYHTSYPYIPGLVLMFSSSPANSWVAHNARPVGKSNYNLLKIAELVMRILFNYSSFPLRAVSTLGMVIAVISFILGLVYLGRAVTVGTSVPGWATLAVLLSFLNGLTLLILGMLGEYVVRLLNQVSSSSSYHVKEVIAHHD